MCDAENVVAFTAEGSTINIVDGVALHFGREAGVYVLNTWVKWEWSVCAEHVGRKVSPQEEWILPGGQCDLTSLTSRKSNAGTGV